MKTLWTKAQAKTFNYWFDHSCRSYYHASFSIYPCVCCLWNDFIFTGGLVFNSCTKILRCWSVCIIPLPVDRIYANRTIQNYEVLFVLIFPGPSVFQEMMTPVSSAPSANFRCLFFAR